MIWLARRPCQFSGTSTRNVEPLPTAESSSTARRADRSAARRARARGRRRRSASRRSFALAERLEDRRAILGRDADAAVVDTIEHDAVVGRGAARARSRVPPSGVNLTAFAIRLTRTCASQRSSVSTRRQLGLDLDVERELLGADHPRHRRRHVLDERRDVDGAGPRRRSGRPRRASGSARRRRARAATARCA